MQISDLRVFIAVVEAGSVTKAAAQLYMSQPSVSERMTQLENELGVRLLDRSPRGVRANEAGREFYARANAIIRQFDDLPSSIAAEKLTGRVSLGVPVTVGLPLFADLVDWMHEHHPGVHLQLFESFSGYLRELLAWERVDLAVLYKEANVVAPGEEILYCEDLYLLSAPDKWFPQSTPDDNEIDLARVAEMPLILTGPHSNLRRAIDNAFRATGGRPNIMADVEALRPLAELVARGTAATILPSSVVDGYPTLKIDARRITNPTIRRYAVLIDAPNHDPNNAAVAALREGIRTLVHDLPEQGRWRGIQTLCKCSGATAKA